MNLTLEDIGRLAGVSRSTVSRVINGQASVSPGVRERVQEVISRTGYAPNAAARSLVSGRSGVIGLVIPSRVHALFEDPYFSRLIQGITTASNHAGTSLTLFLFQSEDEESELYPRVVTAGFLDGLIITATRMGDPLLSRSTSSGLPMVVVGRPDTASVSSVDVDNRGGARMVAHHLCGLGRERIGLIGAPETTAAGMDRLTGFVEGLAERGRALDPALRVDGEFSESSGYQAMIELLPQQPDAVFAASDSMAIGALRALRRHRIRVPEDVAVVGFDGMPRAEKTDPPLTTVHQPVTRTGLRAVEILNGIIRGELSAPVTEVLPVDLVVRESSAAAAGALIAS